jgi:FMN phosphatase YigB (HAD superfamily)
MIKTVMLDLGNVIVPVDFRRCHAALSAVCSIPANEIPKRIGSTGLVQRFETGQVTPADFVREVSEILGMKVSYAEFWEIWSGIFSPEPILPESVIAALGRERRLLLLSNTNVIHFEMMERRFPLLRHFHDYVLSYKVGAMKPDARIYREAIARAGCRAEECFFADDMAAFVEGARAHGIDAVQFLSREQLMRDLAARGVIC